MRKTFITLLFLCELSHQQHNNISGLAARYKIFSVNAQKRNNKVLKFLLIQIQNTCRCRIRWERSLNCITSSIVTTLAEDYLLFIYLCFMLCLFHCNLCTNLMAIYSSFIVTAAYPGSCAYFLVHISFAHRSFVVSSRVVSLAFLFVLSRFGSLSQPLFMLLLPTIEFIKCF